MFRNTVLAAAAIGLALGASGAPARADLTGGDRIDIRTDNAVTGFMPSVGPPTTNVLSNFSGILTTLAVDNVANGVVTSAFPTSTTGSLVSAVTHK
jgi:hypothetical protein